MFDTILNWLGSWWDVIWDVIVEIWRQAGKTLASAWSIGLIVGGWLYWAFDKIIDIIVGIVTQIDAIVFPTLNAHAPGTLNYIMDVANTVFPLEETFAFLVGWVTLLLALTVYRLIKSWIPTLS